MTDEIVRAYDDRFFRAWEKCAARLKIAFEAADDGVRSDAEKYGDVSTSQDELITLRTRYVLAGMALADLFKDLEQRGIADRFHALAEGLQDLTDGVPHSLFNVNKPTGKSGRTNDRSDIWRERANIVLALSYLAAGGIDEAAAIKIIHRKYRVQLKKLQRPNTDLAKSLAGWSKKFANDEISNDVALSAFKHGLFQLHINRNVEAKERLIQMGWGLVKRVADRAAQMP